MCLINAGKKNRSSPRNYRAVAIAIGFKVEQETLAVSIVFCIIYFIFGFVVTTVAMEMHPCWCMPNLQKS